MSTDVPRDLVGAFVLGACSPEEEAQVRAHMTVDPEFRAEVESLDVVHGALLEAPASRVDATPAPDLKRSIMAQVRSEASLFAAADPGERAAIVEPRELDAPGPVVEAPRGTGTPVASPRRSAFRTALSSPARVTALAAVLIALVVGGVVLGGGSGGTQEPRDVIGQVTPQAGPNATVRMAVEDGTSRLRLSGFERAGTGRQYQVWLKTGDADPTPTKVLFDVDDRGNGTAVIPGDMSKVDDVLVTSEPTGGSQAPTTDPVLHVQI